MSNPEHISGPLRRYLNRRDFKPILVVDTREKAVLPLSFPYEVQTLPCGDYGITDLSTWENPEFVIERKSLGDLVSSLTHERERFWREVQKLRQFRFAALVIEGTEDQIRGHEYRSAAAPQSILASLDAIRVRTGVHVRFAGDPKGAARAVEGMAMQYVRKLMKDCARPVDGGLVA